MANVDFDKTPFITPNGKKIFGTVDTAVDFLEALDNDKTLQRTLSPLLRVPMRFYRDNVIACEEDAAEHIFSVVRGVVRSCKIFQHGARNIVAFYLPGDLFGWTDLQHSLSIEAATDTEVLFLKRNVLSIASRENRVASFLLAATTNELGRAQDHILLMSKSAKCRLATFLTDLWVRLGKAEYLDVPMSYQDLADHVGLTIETVSRTISDMERSKMVTRVSTRRLLLQNRLAFGHMMN